MPSRNIVKEFTENQYYHVYNRGVEKRVIFVDDKDYAVFLGLIKKYLAGESHNQETNRHKFKILKTDVELLSYCLMPNHFHLLLYQVSPNGITQLMRRVATGYTMYFNNRYIRVGSLFQGTYKASAVNKDAYLQHISRYIHLNPEHYKTWPYSSLAHYQGKKRASWVNTEPILELFDNNPRAYLDFVADYEEAKHELSILKWQLANGNEEM